MNIDGQTPLSHRSERVAREVFGMDVISQERRAGAMVSDARELAS